MGYGALAMLAMKALMVSALALMLSLIIAAKKLASSKDSGESHHVVYAQDSGGIGGGSHHRRRRDLDTTSAELRNHPYRAHLVVPAGYARQFR